MRLSAELLKHLLLVTRSLNSFQGLEKHQDELDELNDMYQPVEEISNEVAGMTEKTNEPSGLVLNLLVPEDAERAKPLVEKSLEIMQKLKADKELMKKEPLLKAYLDNYELKAKINLSDQPDAYDYLSDNTASVDEFLIQQVDHLPSSQEIAKMSEGDQKKMETVHQFMKAFNSYYGLNEKIHEGTYQDPRDLSDANYRKLLDQRQEKLQKATEEFAKISEKDMKNFLLSNQITQEIETSFSNYYGSKKHDAHAAAKQMFDRRKQLRAYMTPEESSILEGYVGQVKSTMGDAYGANIKMESLPENYRKMTQSVIDLKDECIQKLQNGFQNNEEKLEFFKKLGSKTQEFHDTYMTIEGITADSPGDVIGAYGAITQEFEKMYRAEHGALKRAVDMGKRIESVEQARNPEFIENLKNYYDMMKDTKSGYFLHSNSKEYERMMNTLKNVVELSKKDPLNDLERNVLTESYANISKDCRAYLTDKKLGSRSTEIGEDRFAGALGILNLVDQKEAEKVRARAQAKRGKSVTFDGLKQRADTKKQERLRKQQEAKKKVTKETGTKKETGKTL